jgi:hypothetical protein
VNELLGKREKKKPGRRFELEREITQDEQTAFFATDPGRHSFRLNFPNAYQQI